MSRKLTVAITMNIEADPGQSIWYNGGNQHCVFLAMTLARLPDVKKVWLTHNPGIGPPAGGMLLDDYLDDLVPLHDVIHEVDLLIDMNSGLGPDHVAAVRSRGGKIANYRFGNEYVMAVEATCFGSTGWWPNRSRVMPDALWTNAQHTHTCKGFFEEVYRAPVFELPHLWSPYFIEKAVEREPGLSGKWGYKPRTGAARIGIFEPNMNVVKSSLIPMMLCDRLYRDQPELIQHVYVTNAEQLKENQTFKHIALGMDVVQAGKLTIEPRYPFFAFAAEHVDCVVSHQWENGLNYLYYEALYGGWPLVHNSPMLGQSGYNFVGFDIASGAKALQQALTSHNQNREKYTADAARFLKTVDPNEAAVIGSYDQAVSALFD